MPFCFRIIKSITHSEDANEYIQTEEVFQMFRLATGGELTKRKLSKDIRHFFPKLTTSTIRLVGERTVVYNGIRWRTPADPVLTHNFHQLQENKFIFIHPTDSKFGSRVTFDINIKPQLQITLFGTVLDLNAIGINGCYSLPMVERELQTLRLCYGKKCTTGDGGGEIWKSGENSFTATAALNCNRVIYGSGAEMCKPCYLYHQSTTETETTETTETETETTEQQKIENLSCFLRSLLPGQKHTTDLILDIVKNGTVIQTTQRRWEAR